MLNSGLFDGFSFFAERGECNKYLQVSGKLDEFEWGG